jgi:hypothetical protein
MPAFCWTHVGIGVGLGIPSASRACPDDQGNADIWKKVQHRR